MVLSNHRVCLGDSTQVVRAGPGNFGEKVPKGDELGLR